MDGREEWAVTAAGHLAEALRLALAQGRRVQTKIAAQCIEPAYYQLLFAIGTVPMNRVNDLCDATILYGVPVTDALDAIGA